MHTIKKVNNFFSNSRNLKSNVPLKNKSFNLNNTVTETISDEIYLALCSTGFIDEEWTGLQSKLKDIIYTYDSPVSARTSVSSDDRIA